jgi:hypothetical protein
MRKARANRVSSATNRYVTKRILKSAVGAAVRKASNHAMHSMGYVVKAENGWVIREDSNGKKSRLAKINRAHQGNVVLD